MPVGTMAAVGKAARSLLDSNGHSNVEILGYDHNWDHAAEYPVQLVRELHPLGTDGELIFLDASDR